MVLAFLLVFFGIRSYRENIGNGYVSFRRAFGVGLLIMLIGCACYVIAWEIIYFNFMPDFFETYSAAMIEDARAKGASPAEIEQQTAEMKKFQQLYENNILVNIGMTLIEPLPVGLVMTLISALILKRRKDLQEV